MLLPFFWNVIAKRGAILGNRDYGNKVAAFSLWNVILYILDEKHNSFNVNGGYEAWVK